MPEEAGVMPVISAALEGPQGGAAQCAFVNNTPRFAKASMFGVMACGYPPKTPTQSFRSSTEMNRTLGFSGFFVEEVHPLIITNKREIRNLENRNLILILFITYFVRIKAFKFRRIKALLEG